MGKLAKAKSEEKQLEEKYQYWFSSHVEVHKEFGPDPLLMRKTGQKRTKISIQDYRQRLFDDLYLDHAIDKIAQELSHFILK